METELLRLKQILSRSDVQSHVRIAEAQIYLEELENKKPDFVQILNDIENGNISTAKAELRKLNAEQFIAFFSVAKETGRGLTQLVEKLKRWEL
jgi:hypothetical protein